MTSKCFFSSSLLAAGFALFSFQALAETPADFLAGYEKAARAADAGFKGLSAQRGERFFKSRQGGDWSCSTCHSDNPATIGKHAITGKRIEPLAPAANVERFTSGRQVEKWFKRNCNDVLDRACTPMEKGDVLAYLLTIRK